MSPVQDESTWSTQKIWTVVSLCMLCTGAQLPTFFLAGTLSFIADDLGIENGIGWLPAVNTLCLASIPLLVGNLQDLFGRGFILLASASVLCVGCVVLGLARSLAQAICGVALLGVSAGSIELACISGLAAIVPVRWRGVTLALILIFTLPFCPFVLYSLLFSRRGPHPTWRWAAWIPLVYTAVALALTAIFYRPGSSQTAAHRNRRDIMKRIDYVGALLSLSGIALILFPLQSGGSLFPWSSARIIGTLVIGTVLCLAFVLWEVKLAAYPMIPRRLFRGQRILMTATAIAFFAGMNFYILLNFWPLTLIEVWVATPTKLGLYALAVNLCLTIGTVFWNSLLSLRRGASGVVLFGASVTLTAFAGALLTTNTGNLARSTAFASLAGFGAGGITLPTQTVATFGCPNELLSTCVALAATVRSLGGAIGVSVASGVYASRLAVQLPRSVVTALTDIGLPMANATAIANAYLDQSVSPDLDGSILLAAADGARSGHARSLAPIWYISIASGVCAIVGSLTFPGREFETDRFVRDVRADASNDRSNFIDAT